MKKIFVALAFVMMSFPANAQSVAENVTPGYLTNSGCPGGVLSCFKPYTSVNPLPVSVSAGSITGVLPIANGGTNTNSQTTNGITYFDGTKITSGSNVSLSGNGTITQSVTSGVSSLVLNQYLASSNLGVRTFYDRSDSDTIGTQTAVASGDEISKIFFRGSDGTNFVNSSAILSNVSGAVSTGIVPGRLVFQIANTSGTLTSALTITNDQTATFASSATATAFIPSASTIPTNGMYLPSANTLGFATNSGVKTTIGSDGAVSMSSASSSALSVGANGSTNPALNVDASTASSATGVSVKSAAAASGVGINVISSGSDEPLNIAAKGSATTTVKNTSTSTATPPSAATLTLQNTDSTVNNKTAINFLDSAGNIKSTLQVTNINHTDSSATVNFRVAGNTKWGTATGGQFIFGATSTAYSAGGVSPFVQISSTTAAGSSIGTGIFSNDAVGSSIFLVKSRNTNVGTTTTIVQNGDVLGNINVYGTDGTNAVLGGQLVWAVDSTPGTTDMPTSFKVKLSTDGSATPSDKLTLSNAGALTLPGLANVNTAVTGAVCWNTGGAVTYNTSTTCLLSSRRFKKDIETLENGLDEVMKLRPVSYVYKDDKNKIGEQVGLIAEEVETVDKRLVAYDVDRKTPQAVRYENAVALAFKAIQELKADNDELRNEIKTLKLNIKRR